MYALETLNVLNQAAVANARVRRAREDEHGWRIEAQEGIVTVYLNDVIEYRVDVSDPLDDVPLVQFHRLFDGPKFIASEVESYASQWRRIIHTTPAWNDCLARQQARCLQLAA